MAAQPISPPVLTVPSRPLTWLITGSSSGLGLALVRLAQSKGHTVIATSRNPSKTPELIVEVESKGGQWLPLDVDSPTMGPQLVADLEAQGTHIDVLVNNAGWSVHAPAESFAEEEVRAQMETLYFGPYRLIRAVVPLMRQRRSGMVVNVSSGAGLEGRDSMGAYAAAKAALDGLSKVLAKEVAPFNVRVLTVQLGAFATNLVTAKSTVPLPKDYVGSMSDRLITMLSSGNWKPDGDANKAVQAMYEVVVGEGVGKGREGERVLPLGRDLAVRVNEVMEGWGRTMEVFGEVCGNVYAVRE